MLASALRDFRSVRRPHSEEEIARAWRSLWEGNADQLNQSRSYLNLARALHLYLKLLEGSDDDSTRLQNLENLSSGGWIIALGVERGELADNQVASIFDKVFSEDGTALGEMSSHQLAAVFGAMHQIRQMREFIGDKGPMTTEDLYRLWDYCLAAHALVAPGTVNSLIADRATAVAAEDSRPSGASAWNPNSLLSAIIAQQAQAGAAIDSAQRALDHLVEQNPAVYSNLRSGYPSLTVLQTLESVGIDTKLIRRLLDEQNEYKRGGLFKKGLIGNKEPELKRQGDRAFSQWENVIASRRFALLELQTEESKRLDELVHAAKELTSGDDYGYLMSQLALRDYAGAGLQATGRHTRVPPVLWIADPVASSPSARLPYLDNVRVPTCWSPTGKGLTYQEACDGVRSFVIQSMAVALPRMLQITWIDPSGRGSTAGPLLELLEIDKELLDSQVWSEPEHIEAALRRITDHIAYIEQRCLKDRFDSIDEYNEEAGSLAEADRIVVVTGFPRGFTTDSIERLYQIMDHGRRAGVSVHVVTDEQVARSARIGKHRLAPSFSLGNNGGFQQWNGQLPSALHVFAADSQTHALVYVNEFEELVGVPILPLSTDAQAARTIIEQYAQAAAEAAEVVVDSEALVSAGPDTPGTSAEELVIPIGIMGRGDTLELRLGKGLAQNVLIGGLPGSGKSTLFHTMITSAIRQYDPEELQLYLLDFKQGVEFQPYAEMQLPHARVVAIQSEREFGLSVLCNLREEIDRRAELFRDPLVGADSIKEYRARTGKPLPRLLLIVDEFQVLFNDDDADAAECLQLLDAIVRQGRAFGVHAILGTQTLRGHGHMSQLSGTLDQVAIRIVLKTSDADSRRFLSDENPAGSRLTRPGEAVFNPDGGRVEGNLVFQVAMTSDEGRDGAVKAARMAADETGFSRKPLIFDGTRAIGIDDSEGVKTLLRRDQVPDKRALHIYLGLPVSINGDGAVRLWRRAGGNLLLLSRDIGLVLGALTTGLLTAGVAAGNNLRIHIVENLGIDEDHAELLARVSGELPNAMYRRRKLDALLTDLVTEVRDRTNAEDFGRERILLVVNALQRARELGEDTYFDPTETDSPRGHLRTLLRDGPEVGVHTVVVADTVETLDRRLGDSALSEFGMRFISQCSSAASQRLLMSDKATDLGGSYVIISEPDDDRMEKVRPFPVPDSAWLAAAQGGQA